MPAWCSVILKLSKRYVGNVEMCIPLWTLASMRRNGFTAKWFQLTSWYPSPVHADFFSWPQVCAPHTSLILIEWLIQMLTSKTKIDSVPIFKKYQILLCIIFWGFSSRLYCSKIEMTNNFVCLFIKNICDQLCTYTILFLSFKGIEAGIIAAAFPSTEQYKNNLNKAQNTFHALFYCNQCFLT